MPVVRVTATAVVPAAAAIVYGIIEKVYAEELALLSQRAAEAMRDRP